MTRGPSPRTCPACGDVMNHHADKLTHPVSDDEERAMSPALDGVVERVFACPGCGRIESEREAPAAHGR